MGNESDFVSVAGFVNLDEDDFTEVDIPDPKNTMVALFYSSGTTGAPKGIEITHYSFVANLHTSR